MVSLTCICEGSAHVAEFGILRRFKHDCQYDMPLSLEMRGGQIIIREALPHMCIRNADRGTVH